MWTHASLFDAVEQKCESTEYSSSNRKPFYFRRKRKMSKNLESQRDAPEVTETMEPAGESARDVDEADEDRDHHLSKMMSYSMLLVCTVVSEVIQAPLKYCLIYIFPHSLLL